MIKQDIIDRVHATAIDELTGREAAALVEAVFEIIKHTLASGVEVKISSFGVFQIREKAKRPGRNPHSGEPLTIAARRVVKFKTSVILRDKLRSVPPSVGGR